VQKNVGAACDELARISEQLVQADHDWPAKRADATGSPLERLIAFLEEMRTNLEDDSAADLFETAAGFDAGAISTATLATVFDLDWIARQNRWDAARMQQWIAGREALYQQRIENIALARALVHVELEAPARRPERLLDELAFLFAPAHERERDDESRPPSWRDLDDLAVIEQIPSLFEGTRLPRGVTVPDVVLPLQDPDLRALPPDAQEPWKIVGLVSDLAGKDGGEDDPLREPIASEAWADFGRNRAGIESEPAAKELTRLVRALDRRHRAAADRLLYAIVASAVQDQDGPLPRLAFTESRRKRAEARDRFVQVDRGNRPMRVLDEPDYSLVQRIARNPEISRGFEVRETTRRVRPVVDADGEPCASLLLGSVGKPLMRDLMKQSADAKRLAELRFMVLRNADEEREMRDLAARVQRADEWSGSSGIEDYLDP
jgi:hypothetical protein